MYGVYVNDSCTIMCQQTFISHIHCPTEQCIYSFTGEADNYLKPASIESKWTTRAVSSIVIQSLQSLHANTHMNTHAASTHVRTHARTHARTHTHTSINTCTHTNMYVNFEVGFNLIKQFNGEYKRSSECELVVRMSTQCAGEMIIWEALHTSWTMDTPTMVGQGVCYYQMY